jgi:hypothetical protein
MYMWRLILRLGLDGERDNLLRRDRDGEIGPSWPMVVARGGRELESDGE